MFHENIIHRLPHDPSLYGIRRNNNVEHGMKDISEDVSTKFHFEDSFSAIGLGVTSTLKIENLGQDTAGVYSCKNGIESQDEENKVNS